MRFPTKDEARDMLSLAAPIAALQLGMMLFGVVDMMFLGRLGPEAIAGVGVANAVYFGLFIAGLGAMLGIDTLASRAWGAGQPGVAAGVLVHALALALAVSSTTFAATFLAGPFFRLMGVDPAVAATGLAFLGVIRFMMFPGLLFVACRQYLQSQDVTRPLMWAVAAGNALNAFLNWVLIFGNLGAPALGVRGSALASLTSTTLMLALVGWAAWARVRASGWKFHGWHRPVFVELLALGVPAGLQTLVEVCAFGFTTVLLGRLGPVPTSGHQIALNLASVTFMVPLGISMAAAVRVGQAIGRGDRPGAARAGDAALSLGLAFMSATALLFWAVPGFLVGLYTKDAVVVATAVPLVFIAALFQVFDGAQVVLTGALRGAGETRLALFANVVGHWCVGLPIGAYLGLGRGWGPRGLWWGLLTGLVVTAGILFSAWRARSRPLRAA